MRVLFVSGIDGFCHRYQVLHRAAQLVALGASTTVRHFADPRLAADLAAHDLLFLYRVPGTIGIHRLLDAAADLGVPRIGAIDDLIFVDDPRCLPDLEHLTAGQREEWRCGVRRYRATLALCDAFVAPTEPLVRIADGLGWRAYLHRNSVSPAELELGRRARIEAAARIARSAPVLGYFSGTPSHDEDFASIARALRDALTAEPAARLLVVGPLRLPADLDGFADRIEQRALVPWDALPSLIGSVDVCLAPLLAERPFAAAKGEIKYLEAAVAGVPTIASVTAAYRHAIHDGENGLLAGTQDEWRCALGAALGDRALRERLGAAAWRDVASRYGEAARARELLAIVEEVRGGLRRRGRGTVPVQLGDAPDERPARVALEPDASPAFAARDAHRVSPPVSGGGVLQQRLRIAHHGLARVDVHAVTFGQRITRGMTLELRRDDGAVVAACALSAAELPDRGWLALELGAPEACSAGRDYELEIRVAGARGGAAPSFGLTDVVSAAAAGAPPVAGPLGAARLDGVALDGALALRGFADWRFALRSSDARAAGDERLGAATSDAGSSEASGVGPFKGHEEHA